MLQDANPLQQLMLLIDAAELEEEQEAAEAAAAAATDAAGAGAAQSGRPVMQPVKSEEGLVALRLQCGLCSRWRIVSHECHLIFQVCPANTGCAQVYFRDHPASFAFADVYVNCGARCWLSCCHAQAAQCLPRPIVQDMTGCCADFIRPDCTICSCEQPCDDCSQAVCMCLQLANAAQALSAALEQPRQHGQECLLTLVEQQQLQGRQKPKQPPLQPQQLRLAPKPAAGQQDEEVAGAASAWPATGTGQGRRAAEQDVDDLEIGLEALGEAAEGAAARGSARGRGGKRRKLAAKYTGVVEK